MAKVSLRTYNRDIEAMVDRGALDEAVAHCNHILRTFPKHLETYRLLGKAYLELKRQKDAEDIFTRILNAEPSDFVAHVGMSIIRDEAGKLDDAIWHMERALETQPSNAAVQSELQRLYGRRDGMQPPRIRMTRGALAHMYVQGELYPQAISEIKGVMKEDPGRSDMQALLSVAYYRSGQKNDAADTASALLKRYPYNFDANRVLVEILGADRPDSVHAYRQRVVELDPYAAQVTGTVFQSSEVSDAAVTIERLDWNGQPMGAGSDWSERQAIGLESGKSPDEEPDWLKAGSLPESTPSTPSAPTSASAFKDSTPTEPPIPAEPAEDIPDFLREAGWGPSTGAFDESQSTFAEESETPSEGAQPIEKGEMPEWLQAMAPTEEAQPSEAEEIPDWINKIGTDELPVPSSEESASTEDSDWLNQLGGTESAQEQTPEDQFDWLKGIGEEEEQPATTTSEEQSDWLKGFGKEEAEASAITESTEDTEWLSQLSATEETSAKMEQPSGDLRSEQQSEPEPSSILGSATSEKIDSEYLGASAEEQDDAFAWLENLAAKQGASEGLLTKPEERREEEPDWIKQAKGLSTSQPEEKVEEPVAQVPPAESVTPTPTAGTDELGKSEEERDDAFAWLEGLAAKQGANEGLLTKPEERREEEPDWIKQAKSGGAPQPASVPSEPVEEKTVVEEPTSPAQPVVSAEDLGKSEQERDDAFAWLESLAAKQGASEGLLTKPEGRLENEPEWVKQAKNTGKLQQEVTTPEPEPEQPEEHASTAEDTAAWLRGLEEEEKKDATEAAGADETGIWLQGLEEKEESLETPTDETTAWMKSLDEEQETPPAEPTVPEEEAEEVSGWMSMVEESSTESAEPVQAAPDAESEELPGWLSDLDQEEKAEAASSDSEDLPAWMRDEAGELMAEPTKIEPMRTTDWKPAESKEEEAVQTPPPTLEPAPASQMESEPQAQAVSEPEPEPEPSAPPEPVALKEKKKPAPPKKEVKPATPPEPYREPVTRRGTGMLTMPVDPILDSARSELSRSNIPGALETYGKLIKKGRFLDEVIYDLREALYRYPVEVSIWQTLGDAYMRANRLQDALDAYTKAEELLR